jgi:phage shock protein E
MSIDPWTAAIVGAVALVVISRFVGGRRTPTSVVAERIKSGAKIVDVRTPAEFRAGSYPGAANIPLSTLARRLEDIPKDRAVVLYCRSGARSAAAARILKRAGFADVLNAGGLRDMPR